MAHLRNRHAIPVLKKLGAFWPVVGVLGPRQAGKTTLVHSLLGIENSVSLDEMENREEANRSPSTFLAKQGLPVVLDEIQKAPALFDEIKLRVDRKRIPGNYFLTGSSSFSSKLGIRESLTGRIGLLELLPMTLAELHEKPFIPLVLGASPASEKRLPRFDSSALIRAAQRGGMPTPAFLRDVEQRNFYWRSWLETSILRDLARFFPRGYDPEFAFAILERIGKVLREGELPTLKHFDYSARKIRVYLSAMEEIFLLRRIACHPQGIGKETWLLMDSGLASYLMGQDAGEAFTLSLMRHLLWNEWGAQNEYQGKRLGRTYYKSAQGAPVDAIFEGIPFKIVATTSDVTQRLKVAERPVLGAMKKLGSKFGYLVAPVTSVTLPPKEGGVGILPWGFWS